jgi:hypothetical protein
MCRCFVVNSKILGGGGVHKAYSPKKNMSMGDRSFEEILPLITFPENVVLSWEKLQKYQRIDQKRSETICEEGEEFEEETEQKAQVCVETMNCMKVDIFEPNSNLKITFWFAQNSNGSLNLRKSYYWEQEEI